MTDNKKETMTINPSDLAQWIAVAITEDIASGKVPVTVTSYSELHDFVDANEYCIQGQEALTGAPYPTPVTEEMIEIDNQATALVDCWLAVGSSARAIDLAWRLCATLRPEAYYLSDPDHIAELLRRMEPNAQRVMVTLGADQLASLLDDDRLLNGESSWSVPEVRDYIRGAQA